MREHLRSRGWPDQILGDSGKVVPPSDPEALAMGIIALLDRLRLEGTNLAARVRQRIAQNFSVETLVERTKAALETMP